MVNSSVECTVTEHLSPGTLGSGGAWILTKTHTRAPECQEVVPVVKKDMPEEEQDPDGGGTGVAGRAGLLRG